MFSFERTKYTCQLIEQHRFVPFSIWLQFLRKAQICTWKNTFAVNALKTRLTEIISNSITNILSKVNIFLAEPFYVDIDSESISPLITVMLQALHSIPDSGTISSQTERGPTFEQALSNAKEKFYSAHNVLITDSGIIDFAKLASKGIYCKNTFEELQKNGIKNLASSSMNDNKM
ncbi:unnamed protein product [Phyllotreta striolata]|uniref:Uncharacterized protein n=1 Tax=Phyllotreta striolata TaxID=444603 RepID=A0A9P0GTJ7_PHYSR|nr:unnamed protein product [Phyllotreta striolata]